MRHFAIYAQPWPARLANQVVGSFGRDDTETSRRSVQKSLSNVERKRPLIAEERPSKKCKIDQAPVVEMSSKAKELLMPLKRKRGRPRKHPLPEEEPPKRKRGRPRIHSPRSRLTTVTKSIAEKPRSLSPSSVRSRSDVSPYTRDLLKPKSLAVKAQPRDSNGRFGKKTTTNGKHMRKQVSSMRTSIARAERALQRTKVKRWLADNRGQNPSMSTQGSTRGGKRTTPNSFDASSHLIKRSRSSVHPVDGDDDPIPLSVSSSASFRFSCVNGSLLCRPNPINLARRKWAPDPLIEDSTCDDGDTESTLRTLESDTSGPITPENRTPLPIAGPISPTEIVEIPQEAFPRYSVPCTHANDIASVLVFKPSPVNFARRRWCSTTKSPLEVGSGTRRSQRLRPRGSHPGEDSLVLTPHAPVVSVVDSHSAFGISGERNSKTSTLSHASSGPVRIMPVFPYHLAEPVHSLMTS